MSLETNKKTEDKNRCLNCMQDMGKDFFMCKHCGWQKGASPKELFHLRAGEVLNERYVVGTVIGYGGFGVIYTAWDNKLDRKVAVKELFPMNIVHRIPRTKEVIVNSKRNLEQFNHELGRFLDEAKSVALFENNPCIVSVYDYFKENNTGYIVMEYVDGITLKEYLKINGGRLPYQQVLSIINPIFDAVADVHANKIIHRDIAPDNVFIRNNGTVCLFDFGAARLDTGEEQSTKEIILKPGYSPPEQYRARAKYSDQTDIYAFAAMVYQMLTGEHPPESLDRLAVDEMKPINEFDLEEEVPEEVVNAIDRGLALEMPIRFKKIRDFQAAIEGEKSTEPIEIVRKKRKRKIRLLIAAASCVVAGIIALIPIWNTYINPEEVLAGGEIKPADITIAVLDDEVDMYNDIVSSFNLEYNMININIVGKTAEEYSNYVLNNRNTSLYYLDLIAKDEVPRNHRTARLYDNATVNYSMIPQMNYEGSDWFAASVDFPVMYCNTFLIKYLDAKEVDFEDIDDIYFIETLITEEENADFTAFGMSDECIDILSQYGTEYINELQNYSIGSSTMQDFIDGDLVLYGGMLSEMAHIRNEMQGSETIMLFPKQSEELMYVDFYHRYSISRFSNRGETDAALLFLNYLMNYDAQNVISIQYHQGYPLNNEAQNEYLNTYSSLDEYGELLGKMIID